MRLRSREELAEHGFVVEAERNLDALGHAEPVLGGEGRPRFDMERLVRTIPMGRTGEPEDIANACAFLVSEASSYVTGQTIGVNGGRVVS